MTFLGSPAPLRMPRVQAQSCFRLAYHKRGLGAVVHPALEGCEQVWGCERRRSSTAIWRGGGSSGPDLCVAVAYDNAKVQAATCFRWKHVVVRVSIPPHCGGV